MRNFPFSIFRLACSDKRGLSLIELLIFAAIFSLVMMGFVSIMVAVVRVQSRQSAAAEVNQQSQFLLQQFQHQIERSSLVDVPQDTPASTLTLRMRASSEDPIVIRLSNGIVYIKKGGAVEEQLTTNRVTVSALTFTKRSNPPAKDSVNIAFTMEYNTQNITQSFIQSLQTSVARVSAATFDSNVSPSSTDAYAIGTGSMRWESINGAIYFSNANPPNVGIGIASPLRKLQVSGGDVYIETANANLIMRDPVGAYCWYYKPITQIGAWNISSSSCPF